MENSLLNKISGLYPLSLNENNDFKSFKASGMDFNVENYKGKNLGSVTLMTASGMNGAMTMETVIINPFHMDAPLLSYDRVKAFGSDMCYIEIYDTCLNTKYDVSKLSNLFMEYEDIPETDPGKHWYDDIEPVRCMKKTTIKDSSRLDELVLRSFDIYLSSLKDYPETDESLKMEKADEYTLGLLKYGGPATDSIKEALGEDASREFFTKVFFGSEK